MSLRDRLGRVTYYGDDPEWRLGVQDVPRDVVVNRWQRALDHARDRVRNRMFNVERMRWHRMNYERRNPRNYRPRVVDDGNRRYTYYRTRNGHDRVRVENFLRSPTSSYPTWSPGGS